MSPNKNSLLINLIFLYLKIIFFIKFSVTNGSSIDDILKKALYNKNDSLLSSSSSLSDSNADQIVRSMPVDSPFSRILNGRSLLSASSPRIQIETYKALAGETVRLECPQSNPTWFFRRLNSDDHSRGGGGSGGVSSYSSDGLNENGATGGVEDIIVTRHGVINADYKYKIMCHMTLKHKVIIINNIDFDEEGLYTCLYTQPSESAGSYFSNSNNDAMLSSSDTAFNSNLMQYRYVFNVTVYTLINGLTMNIKPISMKLPPKMPLTNEFANKKFQQNDPNQQYELIDSTLTVRENEEFMINCIVDSSKPAAEIRFNINNNGGNSAGDSIATNHLSFSSSVSSPSPSASAIMSPSSSSSFLFSPNSPIIASSIISSSVNVIKNNDRTYKTVYSARLKANLDDHGKIITCKAENGFSNQKWENRKLLNILFAPVCKDPPNFVYYVGINQTLNVECRILNANPTRITYEWNLNSLNANIDHHQTNNLNTNGKTNNGNNFLNNLKQPTETENENDFPLAEKLMAGIKNGQPKDHSNYLSTYQGSNTDNNNKRLTNLASEGFTSRFKWRPGSLNDFGVVKCKATNEIGTTECIYEIKLGGVPNPPTDCTHTLKNKSAIISCQVGFHQGDPDIYCYLLRKSDNGVYKEHTRNRESCSFIVNDVNLNKLNEFWIYSSNKHGHNKDNGVHLTIGQQTKPIESNNNKTFIIIAIAVGVALFLFLACCFCFKIRKGLSDDTDSVFEADAYQPRNSPHAQTNGFAAIKKNPNNYPVKMIKGVKVANHDSSYDINDHIKDTKQLKSDMTTLKKNFKDSYMNGHLNDYMEKKKEFYETSSYLEYAKLSIQENEFSGFNNKNSLPVDADNVKKKKFNLFKSTSTLPSSKPDKYETKDSKEFKLSHIKPLTSQSLHSDKQNGGGLANGHATIGAGTLMRNGISTNNNNNNNNKMKKSISFTKPLVADENLSSSDDHGTIKESTPLFNSDIKNRSGLLTTVSNTTIINHRTAKLNSQSANSLNESTLIQQNTKMVTFGNNLSNSMRKNGKNNQSISTLTTAIGTTATNTSGSSSSPTNQSTTSPATSSTNNDSEFTNNSPVNNISSNLTVSDQSTYNAQSNSIPLVNNRPKLSTFSSTNRKSNDNNNPAILSYIRLSNENLNENYNSSYTNGYILNGNSITNNYRNNKSSPKHFLNDKLLPILPPPPPPPSSALSNDESMTISNGINNVLLNGKKISDSFETKFLNKLCEEIEVSLNVDCECADDYSSNDFSGDYSFDNELKTPTPTFTTKTNQVQNQSYSNSNGIHSNNNIDNNKLSVNTSNSCNQNNEIYSKVNGHGNTNGINISNNLNNNNNHINNIGNNNNSIKKTNINHLTDLRKNFELNIKQLRGNGNGLTNGYHSNNTNGINNHNQTNKNNNDSKNSNSKSSSSDNSSNTNNNNNNSNSSPNKNQLGVLV